MKKVITIFAVCVFSLFVLGMLNAFSIPYKDIVFTFISVVILSVGCFFLRMETKDVKNTRRFLKTMPIRLGDFFFAVVTSVIIISSSFILNYLESTFLGFFGIEVSQSGIYGMQSGNEILLLCVVAIFPAIFEELFFRGAVLSALSKKPDVRAMIWSAIFFTLMHGSFFNIPSTLVAGFVLAAASYYSGSVYVSMIAHFLNNVLTFVLYIYSERISFSGLETKLIAVLIPLLLIDVYFFLGFVSGRLRKNVQNQGKMYNEGEKIWKQQQQERKER